MSKDSETTAKLRYPLSQACRELGEPNLCDPLTRFLVIEPRGRDLNGLLKEGGTLDYLIAANLMMYQANVEQAKIYFERALETLKSGSVDQRSLELIVTNINSVSRIARLYWTSTGKGRGVRLPLIEDLMDSPMPTGSNVLVEFDAGSAWYSVCDSIAANWIRTGGSVSYDAASQSPDTVRSSLSKLRLDVSSLESSDTLRIVDWYTATLGHKSKEKFALDTLKAADLSIYVSREMREPPTIDRLNIMDDLSVLDRFNDEKSWVEFELARAIPAFKLRKITSVTGIMVGVHGEWAYRRLENAADCIVDFRLKSDREDRVRNSVRIRSARNTRFDGSWHELQVDATSEVTLIS